MVRINTSAAPLRHGQEIDAAAAPNASAPAEKTALPATPATTSPPSPNSILRDQLHTERLLQASNRISTDRTKVGRFNENDAAGITDLRALMSGLSSPDLEHLRKAAEQLPEAVKRGDGTVIEQAAPMLQHALGEDWYSAAVVSAADQCLSAPAASVANIVRGLTLLAGGLDRASLGQVLTALARSLPYEKNEGSLEALKAFADALAQHVGQLDNAAREGLLAVFDLRVKPRKTGSPFLRTASRRAISDNREFTEECRAVRARLKNPPADSVRIHKRAFPRAETGPAALPR